MIDFSSFEEFQGEKPYRLLDQHPDGIHVAMQIQTSDAFLAAIWSNETKQLVWTPEDTYSLAWLQQGTQLAALQNPLSSEDFFFSIYSWPQSHLLQQCSLHFPMGYFFDLVISPNNDFAICHWIDQCEFGFEFVDNNYETVYLAYDGYINRKTNFSTRPVFSSNGHLWVCAYQENTDWRVDEHSLQVDNKQVIEVKQKIGALLVFHRTSQITEIPLIITIPAGYLATNINIPGSSISDLYISEPIFIDTQHVQIQFPSGTSEIYDLSSY